MAKPPNPIKSFMESRKERKLRDEVEELISKLKDESSNLKAYAVLIERLKEALGEELDRLVGPPPSLPKELLEPSTVVVSPEDKEIKLDLEGLEREVQEGFRHVSGEKLKAIINGAVNAAEATEDECIKYLETAVNALLTDTENLLRPFKGDARFNDLLATVEKAKSLLSSTLNLKSLDEAIGLLLCVRGVLDKLKPEALMMLRSTASSLLNESRAVKEEAERVGVRPPDTEEATSLAEKMVEVTSEASWESISYYQRELEETLKQLRDFKDSMSRLEVLRHIDEAVDYVTSKLPELRGEVVEAKRKLKDLIEEAKQGRMLSSSDVDEAVGEVEEAFMKAGANKLLKEVKELYRELRKKLGGRCEVEEPPQELKGRALIERLEEMAKCKEKLERLVKSMVGGPARTSSVEELREALKEAKEGPPSTS